ncbi:hypothetical protein KCP77_22045 [Salmonella enterica subsp. enterica]|nr:hypothetical protein KCP77_22045 [Salmonella enterica subsp. enterica]
MVNRIMLVLSSSLDGILPTLSRRWMAVGDGLRTSGVILCGREVKMYGRRDLGIAGGVCWASASAAVTFSVAGGFAGRAQTISGGGWDCGSSARCGRSPLLRNSIWA